MWVVDQKHHNCNISNGSGLIFCSHTKFKGYTIALFLVLQLLQIARHIRESNITVLKIRSDSVKWANPIKGQYLQAQAVVRGSKTSQTRDEFKKLVKI